MPASLRFIPGTTIRWRARRFVIVDYAGLDALVAREIGKRRFHRVPLNEALVDLTPGDGNAWTPDLVSEPNDLCGRNHHRIRIAVLLHRHHAARHITQCHRSPR
jgi:hypothetical protein